MTYSRLKQNENASKRLVFLRSQLYGKDFNKPKSQGISEVATSAPSAYPVIKIDHNDYSYLKTDLLKILFFASVAIILQVAIKSTLGKFF